MLLSHRKNGLDSLFFNHPVLLSLGLFENTKEDLKNTKDFLTVRTLKNPLKQAENTQKDQGNSQEHRHQGNKNTKEKKDRVQAMGLSRNFGGGCTQRNRDVHKIRFASLPRGDGVKGRVPKGPSHTKKTTESEFEDFLRGV